MEHVFISYVTEDRDIVQRLESVLRDYDVAVWLDRNQLKPGQRWASAIREAIHNGGYFIACFSRAYAARSRSYMNEELTLAIEELRRRPTNVAWFIPVLLDDSELPDREIGAGETLRSLEWVRLNEDWFAGIRRILAVISPSAAKVDELLGQLRSDSARARIRAADTLGKLEKLSDKAVPALLEALDDDNETVRAAASDALGRIGVNTESVIAKLLDVLSSGHFYAGRHAANALARYGVVGLAALKKATRFPGFGIASHADRAIAGITTPDAVPELVDAAREGHTGAITALGNMAPDTPEVRETLIDIVLNSGSLYFRDLAAESLGRIRSAEAVPALEALLKHVSGMKDEQIEEIHPSGTYIFSPVNVVRTVGDALKNIGSECARAILREYSLPEE